MEEFTIGDKVIVKSDLQANEQYGEVWFSPTMLWLRGKQLVVSDICKSTYYTTRVYRLGGIDNVNQYVFSNEMLERI